ncbi:MAG: D12 class N6 adenine-specific DNA methyltransferase [Hyphomonadaceae bacterium]|nr:MAG: D12 class N6 adenine-specific DNA methyltransferase [Hyphomonadaceae bacterium]KAF0182575.1 MAG: D12 class N6 adenine-specific DNA methyltransferase [Hyphomonadaceae bacterium]
MRLAKLLISKINQVPHETYAEPFVGMGGVFLRRNLKPECEIINDISTDVANFFRILRHHYVAFMEMLRFQICSRDDWNRLMKMDPNVLTDLQRAARFLYLQKIAFGGKVMGRNFAAPAGRGGRFDVTKLGPMLGELHERLARVTIERLNWEDFILKYDKPGTLFYLDPPYFGNEDDYGYDVFGPDQFELMADMLGNIKGRFILSINDRPDVRQIFRGFKIEQVDVAYGLGSIETGKKFSELIISN